MCRGCRAGWEYGPNFTTKFAGKGVHESQHSLNKLGLRSWPDFATVVGGLVFVCCSGVWGEVEYEEDELELDPASLLSA